MKSQEVPYIKPEIHAVGTACILLRLSHIQHSDQLSNTQQKQSIESGFSFFGLGHTMLRFLGANNILYYEEMARENSIRHCYNLYDRAERLHEKHYKNY